MENDKNIEVLSMNEDFSKLLDKANEIQTKCSDHPVRANEIRMDNSLKLTFGCR